MTPLWRTLAWLAVLVLGIGATVLQLRAPAEGGFHEAAHAAHADHAVAQGPSRLFAWDVTDASQLTIRHAARSRRFVPLAGVDAGAQTGASASASTSSTTKAWREISESAGRAAIEGAPNEAPTFDAAAYLSLFSQARADRRIESSGAARDDSFGLATPALSIDIAGRNGAALASVTVGARTPDGYGRYVRVAGQDTVLIVPDYQFRPALRAIGVADGQ